MPKVHSLQGRGGGRLLLPVATTILLLLLHAPFLPGVYLWDIPTVSLYLAISNHVAAAAVLSLTLSAGISPRPCVRRRFLLIQPSSPLPLAPQSQTSVTTPPPHHPPRPSPSPAAGSLPGGRGAAYAPLNPSPPLVG